MKSVNKKDIIDIATIDMSVVLNEKEINDKEIKKKLKEYMKVMKNFVR